MKYVCSFNKETFFPHEYDSLKDAVTFFPIDYEMEPGERFYIAEKTEDGELINIQRYTAYLVKGVTVRTR